MDILHQEIAAAAMLEKTLIFRPGSRLDGIFNEGDLRCIFHIWDLHTHIALAQEHGPLSILTY